MNWKMFMQVILLVIVIAIAAYIVCPKYYFYYSQDEGGILRGNTITGKLQAFTAQTGHWVTLQENNNTTDKNHD
jgi:hypothetical protein